MSNYWADRFAEEEKRVNDLATDEIRRQHLQYEKSLSKINRDIEVWYGRIAKNNEVSLAEAKQLLNAKELKEFKWTLDEYIKHGKENGIKKDWSRQLENASAKAHIERLEALKLQVRGQIEKLYNNRESGFENHLKNIYKDQYNRTAFQIAKGTGIGTNLYKLNDKYVEQVIKKPWAPDGKNFSERIWEDKDKLINTLHTEMTQAFIRGDSLEKLADKIAEKMKVSKSNASRLVYTESAAYSSRARLKGYEDLGIEKYEIVATLDNRTSDICQDMDGKVFDLKNYEVGVTANPFHVRCYDEETEAFTNEGWKLFKNLTGTEKVYSLNKETLIPEWQYPIKYISYKHNGKMLHFKNARFDMLVTPNHSMLVQNMDSSVKDKSFKLKEANKIGRKSKNRFFSGMNWIGKSVKNTILGGKEVEIETYLKFMAYFLADGSCTSDKGSYNIKIAQCNNGWMYSELEKMPFKIYKCKESLMIHNKVLGEELKQYGKAPQKYIPDFIKTLTPDLIRIFLIAYSKTDGHVKKGKKWKGYDFKDSITFYTTSNKMASDLGELILKAGGRPSYRLEKIAGKEIEFKNGKYVINNDCWNIYWNTQIYNWVCYMNVEEIDYKDNVYCLELEKHNTLLVRRNGKVAWSGNCRTTTAPYFEDDEGERAARNETTGETEYVPSNMKYKEWQEKYLKNEVEKSEKNDIIKETKINTPKTLKNHENYIDEYYDREIKGLISKEDEAIVANKLQNTIDSSEFSMRFKSSNIDSLLDSGRFMNQFETGTSGGTISNKFRKEATKNLFGAADKLKKTDYEKYGYLANSDFLKDSIRNGTLDMYGDTIIRFNKDTLKGRVTFTVDDSLGNAVLKKVIASGTDKAGISAIDVRKMRSYTDILKHTEATDVADLTSDLGARYIELQYHGELLLSDVKEICFTDKIPNNESIIKLKKAGIKLYKLEGDKIVKL